MTKNEIISKLDLILSTYKSIVAFFYKKIFQKLFTNSQLNVYNIDYTLLLPSSKYILYLNAAQVTAQMQAYINLCNLFTAELNVSVNTQTSLFFEQIQNILNNSIAQLNGFSTSLLDAQYNTLFTYTLPYSMGLTEVLHKNNIDLDTYPIQASLNYDLKDLNNILQGNTITLSR